MPANIVTGNQVVLDVDDFHSKIAVAPFQHWRGAAPVDDLCLWPAVYRSTRALTALGTQYDEDGDELTLVRRTY